MMGQLMMRTTGLATLLAGALSMTATAAILRVDPTATGSGTGDSWTNAYTDPQDAIDAAVAENGDVVWVAAGVYVPTTPVPPESTDPRARTLNLRNGIKVYGGFLGLAHPSGGETALGQRDPETNITTISGDVGTVGDPSDNCARVVLASEVNSETIFDGFTVTLGTSDGGNGAGLNCNLASPRIVRCLFVRNSAGRGGGAVAVGGSPSFAACSFLGNSAQSDGGGVIIIKGVHATFSNCLFAGNVAGQFGGGLAAVAVQSEPDVINCSFTANSAAIMGGGIHFEDAPTEGPAAALVRNSILWGNEPDQISFPTCTPNPPISYCNSVTVSDCDVQDGLPSTVIDGGGNIDDDPLFVSAPDPGADAVWGTADDDYGDLRLALGSPCINNGSNSHLPADFGDLNSNSNFSERTPRDLDVFRKRVLHGTVEMGAYEFGCNADLTNDCEIDGDDQAVLLGQWTGTSTYGGCPPYRQSDLNEDCKVNGLDLAILLSAWGECDACGSEEFGGGTGGGSSSEASGCEGSYELFLQWLGAEDWEAFLDWYGCVTSQ